MKRILLIVFLVIPSLIFAQNVGGEISRPSISAPRILKSPANVKNEASIENLITQSFLAAESGEYEKTIKICEAIINKDPKNSTAYANEAYAYSKLGNNAKAIELCEKGVAAAPNDVGCWFNLGHHLKNSGYFDRADKAFNEAIFQGQRINNPEAAVVTILTESYSMVGDLEVRKNRFNSAETKYLKSIEIDPDYSYAYLKLADLYLEKLNDYEKAAKYMEKGVSFEPNRLSNIVRYYKLGMLYFFDLGLFDDAISNFNKCINCYNVNTEVINAEIKKGVREALESSYWYMMSFVNLGRLYFSNNDFEKSMFFYDSVFKSSLLEYADLTYKDYTALYWDYHEQGETEKKESLITKGLELFPNNPDLLFCKTFLVDEDYNDDLLLLNEILRKEETYTPFSFDYATIYNNIAWLYYKTNDTEKALQYSLHSITLNKDNSNNWETLGEIYYKLNKYEDCINAMTKCLELNPSNRDALNIRNKAYQVLGK